MSSNSVKFLRGENSRLQSLVTKLTGNNAALSLQLKQKEDALAKRCIEVATLHDTCSKYKRARIAPVLRILPTTSVAVCLRCQKATGVFGELKEAVDAFAEKLNAALAAKEAQFEEKLSTALKAKDSEIAKLAAALAEKESKEEERRQLIERIEVEARQSYDETRTPLEQQRLLEQQQQLRESEQRLRDIEERKLQHERESAQRMEEIKERKLQHARQTAQELRDIEEEHVRRVQAIHQRAVVLSRQRRGVADAA